MPISFRSVCSSIFPSVPRPDWLGQRCGWLCQSRGWLGQRRGWLGQRREAQPASQASGCRPGRLGLRPGWMAQRGKQMDGQTNTWEGKSPHSTVLCPLSEPLPCFPSRKPRKSHSRIKEEQGKGTADILMPLGVWFENLNQFLQFLRKLLLAAHEHYFRW